MVRTQIQLTEVQARKIKRIAAERHVSMAEVIRESVDRYVHDELDADRDSRRERALKAIGSCSSGLKDLARRHDDHLAEAYR